MTRKLLTLMCALAVAAVGFVSTAAAADVEADLLFGEASSASVPWQGYVNVRLLLVGADGTIANQFNSAAISGLTLTLASKNGSVKMAEVDAGVAPSSWTDLGDVTMDSAVKELALQFNRIGNDTITAEVTDGTKTLSTQVFKIVVSGPSANTWVVRTGGVGMPDPPGTVLDTVPPANNDDRAIKPAGRNVIVEIFAAVDVGGTLYFTNNVPAALQDVTVKGMATSPLAGGPIVVTSASLVDGYAKLEIQITDLKIPMLLRGKSLSDALTAMSTILNNDPTTFGEVGLVIEFSCMNSVSGPWGNSSGDVDAAGILPDASRVVMSASNDTTHFTPGPLSDVIVNNLPVGGVDADMNRIEVGFNRGPADTTPLPDESGEIPAVADVSPNDLYLLSSSPATQPDKVVVVSGSDDKAFATFAVSGRDAYGNPAAINDPGSPAVFTIDPPVFPIDPMGEGTVGTTSSLTTTADFQGFVPFRMLVSGDDTLRVSGDASAEVNVSLEPSVKAATVSKQEDGSEGETSIAQVGNGSALFEVGTVIEGQTYSMRLVDAESGAPVEVNTVDAPAGADSVAIGPSSKGSDNNTAAQEDVELFNNVGAGSLFAIFEDSSSGAMFTRTLTQTVDMKAGAPDEFPPMVMASVDKLDVVIDRETAANSKVQLGGVVSAYDSLGNRHIDIKDAGLTSAAITNASGDVIGTVDPETLQATIDPAKIASGDKTGVLEIDNGTVLNLGVSSIAAAMLNQVFVPVEDVDTPVSLYLADQAGSPIAPVANPITTTIAVNVTSDNGTVDGSDTDKDADGPVVKDLSVTAPSAVVRVARKSGTTGDVINVTAQDTNDNYAAGNAALTFAPDFDLPVVTNITAVDCGFEITITDVGSGVSLADTVVEVRNDLNELIPSDNLTMYIIVDNGTIGVIQVRDSLTGAYSVTVTPQDKAGNSGTAFEKLVFVSNCECAAEDAACLDVDPAVASANDNGTVVTITGDCTNFSEAVTTVDIGCPSVTVTSVAVVSATEVQVTIDVDNATEDETCDVTVTSGSEVVTCPGAFGVVTVPCTDADGDGYDVEGNCGVADCNDSDADVNPDAAEVCDDGIDNDCDGAADCDDSDCADAAVCQCTDADGDGYGEGDACLGADCDDSDADVNPGAAEICGDGIDNNCDGAIDEDCCEVTMTPASIVSARLGAHGAAITLQLSSGTVSRTSEVTFESGGIVPIIRIPIGNRLLIIALVRGRIEPGTYTVTVDDCEGTYTVRHLIGG